MASSGAAKNPKKTNLLDHHSIKHLLDESVTDVEIPTHFSLSYFVVKSRAYAEDLRLSNVRLLIGSIIIAIALLAQFTKDGVLVEGLFWKDVEKLIDDYNGDRKSK
ncbi:hypothetical protein GW17_00021842 [Ensete ventricosum]|nr:hypothetical protein GW17_00021842 [Ensete ventricosum]